MTEKLRILHSVAPNGRPYETRLREISAFFKEKGVVNPVEVAEQVLAKRKLPEKSKPTT